MPPWASGKLKIKSQEASRVVALKGIFQSHLDPLPCTGKPDFY